MTSRFVLYYNKCTFIGDSNRGFITTSISICESYVKRTKDMNIENLIDRLRLRMWLYHFLLWCIAFDCGQCYRYFLVEEKKRRHVFYLCFIKYKWRSLTGQNWNQDKLWRYHYATIISLMSRGSCFDFYPVDNGANVKSVSTTMLKLFKMNLPYGMLFWLIQYWVRSWGQMKSHQMSLMDVLVPSEWIIYCMLLLGKICQQYLMLRLILWSISVKIADLLWDEY